MKRDVDPRLLSFFTDPAKTVGTKLDVINKKYMFQMGLIKNLCSAFKKQVTVITELFINFPERKVGPASTVCPKDGQ